MTTSYPPAAPTVDQANGTMTVDMLLRSPTRVERRLNNMLLQRLVSGFIFADGAPAPGGAVIFDRILENDLFSTRDVQEIEPGSEFPIVDDAETFPGVAKTAKRGGAVWVTYEARRRNAWDVVNRKLTRLTNTIARKIDTVGLAVLRTDPQIVSSTTTGTDWSNTTSRDPIGDVYNAVASIANQDLGYVADTVLLNPVQVAEMFRNKDVRDALPREAAAANPILSGQLGQLLGLDWVPTNRIPVGEAIVLQRGQIGSLHDEIPAYSRVVDMPQNESVLVQAARICVPIVTDPMAARRIVGL